MRGIIDDYARAGDVELAPHLQVDSVPLTKQTIAKGKFCTIMPLLTFEAEFGDRKFVGLPLQPALTRTLYAATRKGESRSIYVDALLEIVIAVFKEMANGTGCIEDPDQAAASRPVGVPAFNRVSE